MELILATQMDIPELTALCRRIAATEGSSWSEEYPGAEILEEDAARGALYRIVEDGETVGLIVVGPAWEVNGLAWKDGSRNPCELARFGIAPERQGTGLGVQALHAALALGKAAGYDCARILVSADFHHAQRMYERAGFQPDGTAFLWEHDYIYYHRML